MTLPGPPSDVHRQHRLGYQGDSRKTLISSPLLEEKKSPPGDGPESIWMPAVRTPTAPGDLTPVPQGFSTRRPLETTLGNWRCLCSLHGPPPRAPQWPRPNANALSALGVLLLLALEQIVLCRHSLHPCPLDHTPVYYMVYRCTHAYV